MDCVTASYAGVAGSSPIEKEQKFVRSSFIPNPPPILYLGGEMDFMTASYAGVAGSSPIEKE